MATVKDIARLAGVSPTTVSWALNGTRPVREETRKRILEAVKLLNYHPKMSARSLRAGKVFSIGIYLVNTDLNLRFVDYAFQLTAGACHVLGSAGYSVQFDIITLENLDVLSKKALEHSVDGMLIMPQFLGVSSYLNQALPKDFPVVYLQRDPTFEVPNCVAVDQAKGVKLVIEHLWHCGHRELALITGPSRHVDSLQRIEAARTYCRKFGMHVKDAWTYEGLFDVDGGQKGMELLLAEPERPSVVFCFNDYMAIGALRQAMLTGVQVPQEISLVGFDDIAVADAMVPALTTVRQPWFELGVRSAEKLMALLNDEHHRGQTETAMISPALIQRDSVRRCAR
ncbi:LacI family DNA-binding transcriptional regulator [Alicyclobacillus vulcanalis]|uniref:Transcriptional regulator, LacI family n=1 Tax=Alicyclobacillus vulcanalis TaxID=252246 RepID=A0A1N7JK38_9BACL|nr:LacI family DNA-binding transcriptional regulator [Alicyclobacillus vulcanalis]SIS49695.1 transcriptional regulator, LacI family [Alicyclobacillus vulcanalis]